MFHCNLGSYIPSDPITMIKLHKYNMIISTTHRNKIYTDAHHQDKQWKVHNDNMYIPEYCACTALHTVRSNINNTYLFSLEFLGLALE